MVRLRTSVRLLAATLCAAGPGCLSAEVEPAAIAYHNPLDLRDGGTGDDGGPQPVEDGGPPADGGQGPVDGRSPTFLSATYLADPGSGTGGAANLYLADVADLCAALHSDAGLGASWNLLRLRLDGIAPTSYPVAAVLSPGGAIATFDFQSSAGGFGSVAAASGSVAVTGLDPANLATGAGSYQLTFAPGSGGSGPDGGGQLSGTFRASPCAAVPPAPGN